MSADAVQPDETIDGSQVDVVERVMELPAAAAPTWSSPRPPPTSPRSRRSRWPPATAGSRSSAGCPRPTRTSRCDSNLVHYRQLHIHGANGSAPEHNKRALEYISTGQVPVKDLITRHIPSTTCCRVRHRQEGRGDQGHRRALSRGAPTRKPGSARRARVAASSCRRTPSPRAGAERRGRRLPVAAKPCRLPGVRGRGDTHLRRAGHEPSGGRRGLRALGGAPPDACWPGTPAGRSRPPTATTSCQEALIRAWQRWSTYDARAGTPVAWLLGILADGAATTAPAGPARRGRARRSDAEQPADRRAPSHDPDVDLERALDGLGRRERRPSTCTTSSASTSRPSPRSRRRPGTVQTTLHQAASPPARAPWETTMNLIEQRLTRRPGAGRTTSRPRPRCRSSGSTSAPAGTCPGAASWPRRLPCWSSAAASPSRPCGHGARGRRRAGGRALAHAAAPTTPRPSRARDLEPAAPGARAATGQRRRRVHAVRPRRRRPGPSRGRSAPATRWSSTRRWSRPGCSACCPAPTTRSRSARHATTRQLNCAQVPYYASLSVEREGDGFRPVLPAGTRCASRCGSPCRTSRAAEGALDPRRAPADAGLLRRRRRDCRSDATGHRTVSGDRRPPGSPAGRTARPPGCGRRRGSRRRSGPAPRRC